MPDAATKGTEISAEWSLSGIIGKQVVAEGGRERWARESEQESWPDGRRESCEPGLAIYDWAGPSREGRGASWQIFCNGAFPYSSTVRATKR